MSSEPRTLSFKDLEKHSSGDDCWIAVHSKIYDVTDFLDSHPGGSGSTLTQNHNQIGGILTPDSHSQIRWERCHGGL